MNEEKRVELRDAVVLIDQFIQDHLWNLNPKTVNRWTKVSNDIGELVRMISDSAKELYAPTDEERGISAKRNDPMDPLFMFEK